jgi:hypothetical protein
MLAALLLACLSIAALDKPEKAHAATFEPSIAGIMNYDEWSGICTQYAIDQWGFFVCDSVWSQGKVENFCNCSGEKINSWSNNGHDFKSVRYFSPYQNSDGSPQYNRLTYRQWSSGDPWKAQNKDWRLGSACCYQTG